MPEPKSKNPDLENVKDTEWVHHESRSKNKKDTKVKDLNLTSMLDVIFQLLIFFILTATFALGEGVLQADLPKGMGQPSPKKDPPKKKVFIKLSSPGAGEVNIVLANDDIGNDFNALFEQLAAMQAGSASGTGYLEADNPLEIRPNKDVQWGFVVEAFNATVRAKYTNVSFAAPGQGGG